MKLLIVGYGKMGKMVDDMAADHGFEVVGRVDVGRNEWRSADVAVDFTTASALESNFQKYVDHNMPVVIGTTGWGDSLRRLQSVAESSGVGVVASANFSVGVNLFQMMVEEAARRMKAHSQFGAWIHEAHHSTKRDAPSGTALLLRDAMVRAGFDRPIDISSTRAGSIPGIHTLGFDGPSDTIELTHTARDRRGFAAGALLAAKWIHGKTGWHTMQDVLRT